MYQSINQIYYAYPTSTSPQQHNEWLADYSSILLKESQNFYVPPSDNSMNSSLNSTYSSQHLNNSYCQSSPCQTSYNYSYEPYANTFSNSDTNYNKITAITPIIYATSQAMHTTPGDKKLKCNRVKNSRKKFLSDKATDILNEWYEEHQNNPYPVQEEKEHIARMADITVKQVSAWFSNRRNRTQNTKPKMMRRVLEKEINSVLLRFGEDDYTNRQSIKNRLKAAVESSYSQCI